ncbi:MAG: tetratricopeptide repeat protein [Planctomycetota bacterium]|nr:tetratricopeptide repeat protein [Planctomycetota bacterium]
MRFVSSLALPLTILATFLLGGCQSEDIPLTRDYRDEEEDNAARMEYYETAALTYYEGGRFAESVGMWNKVLEIDANRKKAKWGAARARIGQGDIQSLRYAEAYLKEVVNLDWTHPQLGDRSFEVKRDLANTYGLIADYYDRDVRNLENKLATDPNADVRTTEDQIAIQRGKRDTYLRRAVPLYRQVLNSSQDNPYALAGLAKTHLKLENEDLGIMWAERYLGLSQESQRKWKERMGWWEEEVGAANVTSDQRNLFIDRIQGARDKEKKLRLLLGSVYFRRGEYDMASKQYSEVIRLDPAIPAAYIERAQTYAALRQYGRAVEDVEEYLKITDPQRHREERISAAELLDRYQRILRRGPLIQPTGSSPAPRGAPPAGAPRRNPVVGSGSPDG